MGVYITEGERELARLGLARHIRKEAEKLRAAEKLAEHVHDLKQMREEMLTQQLAQKIDAKDPELSQPLRGVGMKFDGGKVQARLLYEGMPRALLRVIDTLDFGAKKYAAHSWQHVENALERYQDASYRHDLLRCRGERLDSETGIHHRAHHIINELFLLELELRAEESATSLDKKD